MLLDCRAQADGGEFRYLVFLVRRLQERAPKKLWSVELFAGNIFEAIFLNSCYSSFVFGFEESWVRLCARRGRPFGSQKQGMRRSLLAPIALHVPRQPQDRPRHPQQDPNKNHSRSCQDATRGGQDALRHPPKDLPRPPQDDKEIDPKPSDNRFLFLISLLVYCLPSSPLSLLCPQVFATARWTLSRFGGSCLGFLLSSLSDLHHQRCRLGRPWAVLGEWRPWGILEATRWRFL